MAPGNVNPAVESQDETIHPELLELTMEIIENRRKMEEEGNISSAVEHMDVVEKGSSVTEKDPSFVEDLDVVEKAQDVEIGAGLDVCLPDAKENPSSYRRCKLASNLEKNISFGQF